jgi:hypothetical protein
MTRKNSCGVDIPYKHNLKKVYHRDAVTHAGFTFPDHPMAKPKLPHNNSTA